MTLNKTPKKEKRKEKNTQKEKGPVEKEEREKKSKLRQEKKSTVPKSQTITGKENHVNTDLIQIETNNMSKCDKDNYSKNIDSNRDKTIKASQYAEPPQTLKQNLESMDLDLPSVPEPRYFFRKRRKSNADNYDEDKQIKRIRTALLAKIFSGTEDESIEKATESSFLVRHAFSSTSNDRKLKASIMQAFRIVVTNQSDVDEEYALPTKVISGIPIPRTYKEAINDKTHGPSWNRAILDEIDALVSNGTWEEHILPDGANTVSTKWVFTIKLKKDGSIERYKARLVARGFSQQYGVDYTETFAPTVRMDTLRLFLAMVARYDLECHHYDIKNAFTESILQEEIYLKPPEGVKVSKGKVLRALRSLYGLKQAGRDWNLLLKSFLVSIGFIQSLADPCLYVHHKRNIWMLVYVDDIAAAANDKGNLDWFFKALSQRFNAKNLGEIEKILGVRITRDRKNRTIYLDQEQYLSAALDQFGITQAKHTSKKIPAADYENLRPANELDERINVTEYQRGIGKLMYAMVLTRPDIAFVVGRLSQFMKDPAVHHGIALKSLMRYLRSTVKQRLRFGPGGAYSQQFAVYTDADWATDKMDRKSISGGVCMFYGGPISWSSKKQNSVATSSA
ncbi:hypothetical protein K3495_g14993, partial [Podosphaera aphanis]